MDSPSSSSSSSSIQSSLSHPLLNQNGSMNFMDDLIKEYLLFRGFYLTLKSFEHEIKSDKDKIFRPEKLTDLFMTYIHQYDLNTMLDLWSYLDTKYFSRISIRLGNAQAVSRKYELFLLRYYLVHAVQTNRMDKVHEFFENYVVKLQSQLEWKEWFSLSFIKNPEDSPQFSVYFNKNWIDTFMVSFQNFLTVVFQSIQFPRLLNYDEEGFWSKNSSPKPHNFDQFEQDFMQSELNDEFHFKNNEETLKSSGGFISLIKNLTTNKSAKKLDDKIGRKITLPSINDLTKEDENTTDGSYEKVVINEKKSPNSLEDTLEEIEEPYLVLSQDDYKEHRASIILCKFSYDGKYVASVDSDGVIKIWTTDNITTTVTTLSHKTTVLSFEWERRSSNIFYIGTKQNILKVFDLQIKKFVQELALNKVYPLVNQIHSINNKVVVNQKSVQSNSQLLVYESNPRTNYLSLLKSIDFDFYVQTSLGFALSHMILGCSDGCIRWLDYEKYEVIISQKCHDSSITSLKMNKNEDVLLTSTQTETTVWSLTDDLGLRVMKQIPTGSVSAFDSTESYVFIMNTMGCNQVSLNINQDLKLKYKLEQSITFDLFNSSHLCTLIIGSQNGLLRIFKLIHQF